MMLDDVRWDLEIIELLFSRVAVWRYEMITMVWVFSKGLVVRDHFRNLKIVHNCSKLFQQLFKLLKIVSTIVENCSKLFQQLFTIAENYFNNCSKLFRIVSNMVQNCWKLFQPLVQNCWKLFQPLFKIAWNCFNNCSKLLKIVSTSV